MRWKGGRKSSNVEDRRGQSAGFGGGSGSGLWGQAANTERQILDPGDLEEALTAATAIGDDRLQKESGRGVVPDSFTHGSSAQRVKWFRTGFESGDINRCDTFSVMN